MRQTTEIEWINLQWTQDTQKQHNKTRRSYAVRFHH